MQPSRSAGSTLLPTSSTEKLDQDKDSARPIRHGVRLPTRDVALPNPTTQFDAFEDEISNAEKGYLDYMLFGRYPEGPFSRSMESDKGNEKIACLISKLIEHGQYTALNELLQECDSLYYLNIQAHSFSPNLFSRFLQTVSESQPNLRQLMFVVPASIGLPTHFSEKAVSIINFILRSPQLERFNIVGLDDQFSPKILEAIATVGNAKSIDFRFRHKLSDTAGESLRQLISGCAKLQSVCLKEVGLSTHKSAEIFHALRNCPQLTELSFSKWQLEEKEALQEFQSLLQYSSTLEHFTCVDWFSRQPNESLISYGERLNAFNLAIAANRSLKSLSLGPLFPEGRNDNIAPLLDAAQAQSNIQSLEFDRFDFIDIDAESIVDGLELLADHVEKNRRIIQIKGLDTSHVDRPAEQYRFLLTVEQRCATAAKLLKDRLARNSAIASGDMVRIFSKAFFPSPGALVGSNHIGDPGLHLTDHILRLSPDLSSFGNAMVEIALTVDETARHEQTTGRETEPTRLPDSGST